MEENNEAEAYIAKYNYESKIVDGVMEVMNIAGELYESLRESPVVEHQVGRDEEKIAKLKEDLIHTNNKSRRKEILEQIQEEESKPVGVVKERIVPPDVYSEFVKAFRTLWTALRSQITDWVRPKTEIVEVNGKKYPMLSTKEAIDTYFDNELEKITDPITGLKLFYEMVDCLKMSGLYNFGLSEIPLKYREWNIVEANDNDRN